MSGGTVRCEPAPHRREFVELLEERSVQSWGIKSKDARPRRYPEAHDPDPFRTAFQRDRDRIIYSTAFKRMAYKTQVFVVHEGDFYRTRLTHTIEVMQISRTLARAIGANEDLVEAIAYGHDLGHSPFGHAGEEELNRLMAGHGGFDHNLQSLRIVDVLEKKYSAFEGLNLTFETREGLARHHTRYDNPAIPDEFKGWPQPSVEAQIVNVADQLAFSTHDIEDALWAGLITEDRLLDANLPIVREAFEQAARGARDAGGGSGFSRGSLERIRGEFVRNLIYLLNHDVIRQTMDNIRATGVQSPDDVRALARPVVEFSPEVWGQVQTLQSLLFDEVYNHWTVLMMVEKGKKIVRELFEAFVETPALMSPDSRARYERAETESDRMRVICDYISGMTDRYAMDMYNAMFEPYERILTKLRV